MDLPPPNPPPKSSIKPDTSTNPTPPSTETHSLTPTSPNPKPKPKPKPKRKPRLQSSNADHTTRKPRKRSEKEILTGEDDHDRDPDHVRTPKKRKRQESKQLTSPNGDRKLLLDMVASSPSSIPVVDGGLDAGRGSGEDNAWEIIAELVMWKDVAKSALWFGSGSVFFLSSALSKGSNFSIISAASNLGILMLGMAFFNDSLPKRERKKPRVVKLQLTEEDFLRAARLILPVTNVVLAKTQKLFSGEPSMTLKVAPVLLLASKFGHLITPWRLLATGFFLSFTLPKLYSSYSEKIQERVEQVRNSVKEAWKSCPKKKLFATSTAMILWNMCSVKMRMFAAFMSVVFIRHQRQKHRGSSNDETEGREGDQHQEMMIED